MTSRVRITTEIEILERRNYFLGRRIEENIRLSSWASIDNIWHSACLPGFAFAIILSQCLVSFASFLEMSLRGKARINLAAAFTDYCRGGACPRPLNPRQR
jgi:hypothetical protein